MSRSKEQGPLNITRKPKSVFSGLGINEAINPNVVNIPGSKMEVIAEAVEGFDYVGGLFIGKLPGSSSIESVSLPVDLRDPSFIRAKLSSREQQIYSLLMDRRSNREIAENFGISKRTVEIHVQRIYGKLGVENGRRELLAQPKNQEHVSSLAEHGLTKREQQTLNLLRAGMYDKEIAKSLGVSIKTIQNYVDRIRQKVGRKSRWELMA